MALVDQTSVLRVQSNIDDRQAASLDAIAFGANVIDVVYDRLVAQLGPIPVDVEAVFADAWSIIDWIHRIDGLVGGCRGLPRNAAAVVDFRNGSSLVESHRHSFQHPAGSLPAAAQSGRSPWGHLCWTWVEPASGGYAVAIATPSMSKLELGKTFRYPDFRVPRSPVDWVSLYGADGEAEISLTGQRDALVRFIRRLEAAVQASGPGSPGEILRIVQWPER